MDNFSHGSKKSQPIILGKTWFPKGLVLFLVLIASGLAVVSETDGSVFKSRYRASGVPKVDDGPDSKQFAVISLSSKSVRLQVGKAADTPFGQTAETTHQETLVNPLGTKVLTGIKATASDLADTQAIIFKLKEKAIELGVTEGRVFIVIGSTLAGFADIQNFARDLLEIHGLAVEILSSQAEAEMAVLAICPDPKMANSILVVDVGSGTVKLTTQFARKGFVTALNTTSLPGVSEIAKTSKTFANEKKITLEAALEIQIEKFENQIQSVVEANPAIANRETVIVTGGIPFVASLLAGAEGKFWNPTNKAIRVLAEKILAASKLEYILESLNEEADQQLVSNLFTLDQLKSGAAILAALNRQVFVDRKVYFAAQSSPSWEMAYGLTKLR